MLVYAQARLLETGRTVSRTTALVLGPSQELMAEPPRRIQRKKVWAPNHPLAHKSGLVYEHRKILWDAGILTDPSLVVHHRNEDPFDNRIENLEPKTDYDHKSHHGPTGYQARINLPKTHCPHGHPYDDENTYHHPRGQRVCKACARQATKEYKARKRGRQQ